MLALTTRHTRMVFGTGTHSPLDWDSFSAGLANGSLTQSRLDDMVVRTVLPYYYVGIENENFTTVSSDYSAYRDIRGNHSAIIRKIGGESLSLLKNNNENGLGLPLNKPRYISPYGC